MKTNFITVTSGDGHWSRVEGRRVRIIEVSILWTTEDDEDRDDDESDHGELIAVIDGETWDCNKDGLIYTDKLWIQTFRTELKRLGLSQDAVDGIDYSEQGMQGHHYVSMDIDHRFIQEFKKLDTVTT